MTEQQDDLSIIQDQARRFLTDAVKPDDLKKLLENPGSFAAAAWTSVVELGWPAVALSEERGGLGLGWRALCVLAEELGRAALSLPLTASASVAQWLAVQHGGSSREEIAAALGSGAQHACLALAKPGDSGIASPLDVDLRSGELSGATALTAFGATAHYALVLAGTADSPALVLAPLEHAGVARIVENVIDNSRAAASLRFQQVPVVTLALGEEALHAAWHVASLAALATAFEQIGGAQVCLEMARDYALERKAFGQPIGRFQSIKAKLADMYVRTEMARGCALDALAALEQGGEWMGLAAAARVAAIDAYEFCAQENIQTHGAIGVTWEATPHHHYRRSRALAVELGASVAWRERLLAEVGFDLAAS